MRRLPLAFPPSAAAFSPPGEASGPAAVAVRNAGQLDIVSSVTGERLRVLVWQPPGAAPPGGFPVLYALDGDETFGMLTDLAAALAPAALRAGLRPAMIVAVGYAPGDGTIERRSRDFTPRAKRHVMPERPNGEPWPKLGGGDDFLATIENDVKPLVGAGFPADESTATLFGHSLGGLMTLHALMTRPGGFARYFASSPSLWVNERKALRDMDAFLTGGTGMATPIPLRLTVGSQEETLSPWDLRGDDASLRRRWVEGNRMVGNARDLAALIEARGGARLDFRFDLLDGFDHGSARAVAARRAIRFAIDGE